MGNLWVVLMAAETAVWKDSQKVVEMVEMLAFGMVVM
jgi:hypothetical protein